MDLLDLIDHIEQHLYSLGREYEQRGDPGRGYATVNCPSHEDTTPSMSIRKGNRGLLIHCYAGCTVEEICESMGLRVADLFYDRPKRPLGFASTFARGETLFPSRCFSVTEADRDAARLFVDLHKPRPTGLERARLIADLLTRVLPKVKLEERSRKGEPEKALGNGE